MTYTEECHPGPEPVCRTVYETVCHTGGYSAHSYSNLPYGYRHRRDADPEPEAEADPQAEAGRDGKSYGGHPVGYAGYGVVPPPLGFGPRLKHGYAHPPAPGTGMNMHTYMSRSLSHWHWRTLDLHCISNRDFTQELQIMIMSRGCYILTPVVMIPRKNGCRVSSNTINIIIQ